MESTETRAAVLRSKTLIFTAAGLSFLGSIGLWFSGAREEGMFVGLWVPSILAAGALLLVGERDD
ncbi:MAG: hypothetical protein QNK05_16845 [Myxococcota bacterium]|nr:hypothetical protein [Myxococcota bacterium]